MQNESDFLTSTKDTILDDSLVAAENSAPYMRKFSRP